jgi:hypothetical protein
VVVLSGSHAVRIFFLSLSPLLLQSALKRFLLNKEIFSRLGKVAESTVDKFNLLLSQRELASVNKALEDGQLVYEYQFLVISVEVDGVKVAEQQLLVQEVLVSLVYLEIRNCATNLEKILLDVVLVHTCSLML